MTKKYAIGTDIGGSHISAFLMNMEEDKVVPHRFANHAVNNQASAPEILDKWQTALSEIITDINKSELYGIGFAMPGPFDYETGIARFTHRVAKYEKLNGVDVGKELRHRMALPEDTHIRFINDATSFAIGEAWKGSTKAFNKSIALTLGTGFGSAFIESGIPVLEDETVPKLGCVWHLPYKSGIADDYFSTRWFENEYAKITGTHISGVKYIADKASFDPKINNLFETFGNNLAEFIGPWIKQFNAQGLVIGGNMTGAYNLFGPAFVQSIKNQSLNIHIHISQLNENAAMIGSARLMDENFWAKIKPLLSKM